MLTYESTAPNLNHVDALEANSHLQRMLGSTAFQRHLLQRS
ncbi:MAG: hypothetical protein ACHBN1_37600 [Heteroscytonema crispum UTEX LB 1556]